MELPEMKNFLNFGCLLAIIGLVTAIYWIVIGIIWLFNHIVIK